MENLCFDTNFASGCKIHGSIRHKKKWLLTTSLSNQTYSEVGLTECDSPFTFYYK